MGSDTEYDNLHSLNAKFDFLRACNPQHLTKRKLHERICFLLEEVGELTSAAEAQDLAEIADALIDIVYVAKGTAVMLGLPWEELWDDVHRANMEKEFGVTERGLDLIKPPGWRPPQTHKILVEHGYRTKEWFDDSGEFIEGKAHDDE